MQSCLNDKASCIREAFSSKLGWDANLLRYFMTLSSSARRVPGNSFNLLKPTSYGMNQQVENFNNCMLCPLCIYASCICLTTNSELYHLQHKLIGFYN
jgi:hypothetical protein